MGSRQFAAKSPLQYDPNVPVAICLGGGLGCTVWFALSVNTSRANTHASRHWSPLNWAELCPWLCGDMINVSLLLMVSEVTQPAERAALVWLIRINLQHSSGSKFHEVVL